MKIKKVALSMLTLMLGMFFAFGIVKADTSISYPFDTGSNAFNNGVKWTGPTEAIDHWQFLEIKFDGNAKVNLQSATYIALQIKVNKGAPGITYGVLENFDRFATCVDGKKIKFLNEDETLIDLNDVLYGAVNIPEGKVGTLLIPIASLAWQWNNNGSDLSQVGSFYLTTNSLYNYNWELELGGVGYYTGDPAEGAEIIKLRDLSKAPAQDQYYLDSNGASMEVIGKAPVQEMNIEYPFRDGEQAFLNGKVWKAPATASTVDDWQKLKVAFDNTTDLSAASYLVIQMENVLGAPGLTYELTAGNGAYSIAAVADGGEVYYSDEEGLLKPVTNVLYGSITVNVAPGALVIPMDIMDWQVNPDNEDLTTIDGLVIKTNLKYNYNYAFKIGEVGYFSGDLDGDFEYHKLLDLTNSKSSQFSVQGDVTNDTVLQDAITVEERTVYGDTIISFTATGTLASQYGVWDGGSYGKIELVTDSYGDTAVQLSANGINAGGDQYTAITIPASGFSWENRLGVTFWAKNDSEKEIAFNLEVDNRIVESGKSDRFNISQGNRFYLYDVNTEKTYIYMTKPTITLPVGFEGWVRVPFTAFKRADWSNNGVTLEQFMKTGTIVSYLAVTIHATAYNYMPFSINKIGAYQDDPSFISVFVKENEHRLSIETLMELDK